MDPKLNHKALKCLIYASAIGDRSLARATLHCSVVPRVCSVRAGNRSTVVVGGDGNELPVSGVGGSVRRVVVDG